MTNKSSSLAIVRNPRRSRNISMTTLVEQSVVHNPQCHNLNKWFLDLTCSDLCIKNKNSSKFDLSKVWIGMKVLQANSIILGTRKLWRIFSIKQKFSTTAAQSLSILVMFLIVFTLKTLSETLPNLSKLKFFELSKKAVVVSNFCTIFWYLKWLNWPARLSYLFRP